ncbi:hypothetical protein PBAL39_15679 [Pedobacter sp. BAL39]|uniref:helix-turn-helix domain-containing protein n=1 Tax=Pedobacter sp. BAL39 TaxID=391596 RepID=UPI0001559FD2|nr:helix-turn-helix domain-containing protein [Pedobacter sp. BAL39]EDM37879.1 hypothetical protein PBAL39_15679 [Pedobacter sp. BAL39]
MHQQKILEMLEAIKLALANHTLEVSGFIQRHNAEPEEIYLNTQEALHLLQRSERTLYYWIDKHLITVKKIGANNYFLKSQILALINRKGGSDPETVNR